MDTTRAIGKAKHPKTMSIAPTGPRTLPVGFPLDNGLKGEGHAEYIIENVLGDGGFGIVYKAKARMRSKNGRALSWTDFAVKEFFHRECSRSETYSLVDRSEISFKEAKSRFKKEAEKLHELEIPNVIEVNECFERNNTVYYVMQFVEGYNLQEYVAGKTIGNSENCALSEQDALAVMTPIIEAVEKLHNNKLLHLDIKPNNIMLGKEGGERDKYVKIGDAELVPILIDFGTSVSSNSLNKKVEVKYRTEGYSSPEQSYPDQFGYRNEFDRRLDVFALGATMYFLLTGLTPPDAPAQLEKFDRFVEDIDARLKASQVGDMMREAIVNAMNPCRQKRTASARQLLNDLGVGTELEAEMLKREKRRRRNALLYLLAFVIVGGAAFYMWVMQRDEMMNSRQLQEAIDQKDRITLIEYATLDSIRAINELVRGYEQDDNTLMAWYWAEYVKSHQDSIKGDEDLIKKVIARSEVLRESIIANVDTLSPAYKTMSQLLE